MNETELLTMLDDLGRKYETGPSPWRFDEVPAETRESLVPAIVGLKLPVARWEPKLKLSQNRTPADQARVIGGFQARGSEDDRAMIELMRR
jgi:transcriptional regulator